MDRLVVRGAGRGTRVPLSVWGQTETVVQTMLRFLTAALHLHIACLDKSEAVAAIQKHSK